MLVKNVSFIVKDIHIYYLNVASQNRTKNRKT